MSAITMATAWGAMLLLLSYELSRRTSSAAEGDNSFGGDCSKSKSGSEKKRLWRRPAHAPANCLDTIYTLSEALRFMHAETLGKWPIADLAFGINYFIRRKGNLQVASVYAGENSVQLKGAEIIDQLYYYLRLLTLCILFSKKPFPVFLESAGFSEANVLLQKPKAGILKPAFTILRDENSKCFLLLIRGTHSIKDTLTAATGAVVPFHHSVLDDGSVSNLVLGYAHCGMVAAARWIAKLSTPILLKAVEQNPDYDVKIVGHSLGGGTAALLTYILREQKGFSAATCFTFAPAACMTWELAESGKHFITTIVNGSDLVPTFSAASVDDLHSEITASSRLNDLRDRIERNRVLKVIYRSATALGSRLSSVSNARARLLRPVSSGTKVRHEILSPCLIHNMSRFFGKFILSKKLYQKTLSIKRARVVAKAVVKTHSSISLWACMGPRRHAVSSHSDAKSNGLPEAPLIAETISETVISKVIISSDSDPNKAEYISSSDDGVGHDEADEEEDKAVEASVFEEITEGELCYELEKELRRQESEVHGKIQEEEAAMEKITEEEKVFTGAVENHAAISPSDNNLHFYPPGRIMHIISAPSSESGNQKHDRVAEERVGIYETQRELYRKLRLSRNMIKDHYMPVYEKMMELLIKQLEEELNSDYVVS